MILRTIRIETLVRAVAGLLLVACGVAPAAAQLPVTTRSALWVGAPLDDYLRLLQLSGAAPLSSRMLRPLESELQSLSLSDTSPLSQNPWRARYGSRQRGDTGRFGLEIYEPIVRLTENSAVPFGTNDGALWAGRGLSGAADVGAALRYGPLTVRLAPTFTYSQNANFTLGALHQEYNNGVVVKGILPGDMSPYADPYMSFNIDMPQRFGDGALHEVHWGQSSAQLRGYGVRALVGTENMWWGPGQENALLMTNNGGGFPHVGLGTDKPLDVFIGRLEMLYTVGWLHNSDYWRATVPDSMTKRWLNALSFVFEPRGAPGLYLGATRDYYAFRPAGGLGVSDLTEIFQPFTKVHFETDSNPSGNDRTDQMLSFFFRWVMPESHFEVYGEFGRNDHAVDLRDLILEPDHATAYILGLQKLFPFGSGFVRVSAEVTALPGGLTRVVRAQPTWYAHYIVTPGYTEQGQVIGGGVGPGGDAKSFRVDRVVPRGSLGVFAQWQRVNTDQYFREHFGPFQRGNHDVFLGFGARAALNTRRMDFSAELLRQDEYNRYEIRLNDLVNYHLTLATQIHLP